MKYCEKCGFSNEDTAKYCEECGAPLAETQEQSAPAYDAGMAESTAEPQNRESAVSVVRRMLSSPILLAIAVLLALSVVFTVIKSIDASYNLSLTAFTISALEGFDLDLSALESNTVYNGVMSFLQTKSIGLAISSSVPSILLCVALFMQYSAARTAKGDSMGTAGLTVIRVMAVLSLIGAILVSVLTVGLFGFLIVAMSQTEIPAHGHEPVEDAAVEPTCDQPGKTIGSHFMWALFGRWASSARRQETISQTRIFPRMLQ